MAELRPLEGSRQGTKADSAQARHGRNHRGTLALAEYILAGGNTQVILCERGIRTFEKATRNTLDISAIPVLQAMTHLPVVVDPSHAVGLRDKVPPVARAAVPQAPMAC